MKEVEHSSFLSIPSETREAQPWSAAAAARAAADAAAAANHGDFAQDLWRRLVDRLPADPPSIGPELDASASLSPISQDLGGSCAPTIGSFFEDGRHNSAVSKDPEVEQVPLEVVGGTSSTSAGPEPAPTRRQLFAEGAATSKEATDHVLCLEDSMLEECRQFSGLLRRHGFPEVPHRSVEGGGMALDVKGLWSLCTEVLHAYGDRGRRLRQALLGERSEERQKSDGRVQELLRQNAKLQEELNATRSSRRDLAVDASSLTSPARNQPVREKDKSVDLAFRTQRAEALARQRERELEKLKSRLEQALVAVKRKEADSPGKAMKAESAETTSLRKQLQGLTFRLEEAEAKLRQAEAVQSRQAVVSSEPEVVQCAVEAASKVEEAHKSYNLERERRAELEDELRQVQLQHAAEVRGLSSSLQASEEKADRLQAELRVRHSSDTTWQREASKLREDLVEARKAWKGMDARSLMKRDKELRRLGLNAQALEESVAKTELVELFLELCRVMKTKDLSGLLNEVRCLVSRQNAVEATQEMMQLAQGALDALKDLHGKNLSAAEVLGEIQQMCTRKTSRSCDRETQACLEHTELVELSKANQAHAYELEQLAILMDCSVEELPMRAKTLVKKSQDQVSEHRTACKLREDLAEARRAWKSVDTRSLIKRDKELRRLGLDKDAVEESIPKADLVDLFLELCRLLKTKDMSDLVSQVKSLSSRPSLSQAARAKEEENEGKDQRLERGKQEKIEKSKDLQETDECTKSSLATVTSELEKLRETSQEQAGMLSQLAAVMGCHPEELPNRAQALLQKCHEHLAAHRLACKLREDLAEARRAWKAQGDGWGPRVRPPDMPVEEAKADLVDMFLELRRVVKTLVSEVEMLGSKPSGEVQMMQLAKGSLDALQELHGRELTPDEVLCKVKEMCSRWKRPPDAEGDEAVLTQLSFSLGCSNDELPERAEAMVQKCREHLAAQHIVTALQKLLYVESVSEVLPALKEVLDVAALRQKVMQRVSASSGQLDLAAGGA